MKFLLRNRRFTNFIRSIFDNLMPPIMRDSFIFSYIFRITHGKSSPIFSFKKDILSLSDSEIEKFYKKMSQNFSRETDLNEACVLRIIDEISDTATVLDIGAGSGYLCKRVKNASRFTVVDPYFELISLSNLRYKVSTDRIESLSFTARSFDTVVCTHVLEHVLNFDLAVSELRRVCSKKLIIVVPMQRPYKITPDLHIHFFPSPEFFLIRIRPQGKYLIEVVDGDIFYIEYINHDKS